MAQNGNKKAEQRLYDALYPLAVYKMRRSFPQIDGILFQEMMEYLPEAMCVALKRFNPDKGVKISTWVGQYVFWFMHNSVLRYRPLTHVKESLERIENNAILIDGDRRQVVEDFARAEEFLDPVLDRMHYHHLLQQLTPTQRNVVQLRGMGKTYQEIATESGVSRAGVNETMNRSRIRLQKAIEQENCVLC